MDIGNIGNREQHSDYDGGSSMFAMACTYDGENRMIGVTPTGTPLDGQKRLTMTSDYRGRRARKQVETYALDPNDPNDGSWQASADVRFVYDGWRVLFEIDGLGCGTGAPPVESVMHKYTWGLDLSNSLEGAGGIGGLLAMSDPDDPNDPNDTAGEYVYTYDANGNVGQLLDVTTWDPNDPNTAIAAHYEYDPYGNRVNHDPNTPEAANPFRFSTKYLHEEIGWYDFGYRLLDTRTGRWTSRDSIEEEGGENLYAFLDNAVTVYLDPLGECATQPSTASCTPRCDSDEALAEKYNWGKGSLDKLREEVAKKGCRVAIPGGFKKWYVEQRLGRMYPGACPEDKQAYWTAVGDKLGNPLSSKTRGFLRLRKSLRECWKKQSDVGPTWPLCCFVQYSVCANAEKCPSGCCQFWMDQCLQGQANACHNGPSREDYPADLQDKCKQCQVDQCFSARID